MHGSSITGHLSRLSSTSRRIGRTVIAMTSVWCLGCSAFDPIVDHLLGSGASMRCEGESAADESSTGMSSGAKTTASVDAGQDDRDPQTAVTCGCESCVAPAAAVSAPTFVVTLPHAPLRFDLATPLSEAPQPLVPPPQSTL